MVRAPLLLVVAVLLLASPQASRGDPGDAVEIDRCAQTIRTSRDPVARSDAVRRLGRLRGDSVPVRLGNVVRDDPDADLRVEAAVALGTSPEPRAALQVVDLLAHGGTQGVRAALARSLSARKVEPESVIRELELRRRDPRAAAGLLEALGASEDPVCAGWLEMVARTRTGEQRECALRALANHRAGGTVLPDLIPDLLAAETDVDCLVTLLACAERHGDQRVQQHGARLVAMKSAPVGWALANAEAHIADRAARGKGEAGATAPRVRDLKDVVYVVHQTPDLPNDYREIRSQLAQSRPQWEDVRVGVVAYLEPNHRRTRPEYNVLAPTRDLAKLDAYFEKLIAQTSDPRGIGSAAAIEDAFARTAWRWDAVRTVILHADDDPRDLQRACDAVSLHTRADGTKFRISFRKDRPGRDVPRGLERLAKAGGTTVDEQDPPDTGRSPK